MGNEENKHILNVIEVLIDISTNKIVDGDRIGKLFDAKDFFERLISDEEIKNESNN